MPWSGLGVAAGLGAEHGDQPLGDRLGRELLQADGAVHRLQVGGVEHGQGAVLHGPLERPALLGQDLADRLLAGLGGVGGSFACGDTATGVAWAVTKNRISNDFSTSIQLGQLIAGPG